LELVITLEGPPEQRLELYGPADSNLRAIRDSLGVKIFARDGTLKVVGDSDAVGKAAAVIDLLQKRLRTNGALVRDDVGAALATTSGTNRSGENGPIVVHRESAQIRARTPGQAEYIRAIEKHDLCFCLGPAGTGKTYLAVAMALSLLKSGKLKRIVLARPAVEAGEKLGFLPGDMQAKVNPYLRPLFDAMNDMMDYDQVRRFMANDVIEIIPLAFMRGRTFNNAAIILDEAQNATVQQTLMFLTRLGHHSKMIVTGDDSQSDLDHGQKSGLVDAVRRLDGLPGIGVVRLSKEDIVRHKLVMQIVQAYDDHASAKRS
jgi:phosphate starvation-inducible PhoH-like protein